jgi:hypothetical protein
VGECSVVALENFFFVWFFLSVVLSFSPIFSFSVLVGSFVKRMLHSSRLLVVHSSQRAFSSFSRVFFASSGFSRAQFSSLVHNPHLRQLFLVRKFQTLEGKTQREAFFEEKIIKSVQKQKYSEAAHAFETAKNLNLKLDFGVTKAMLITHANLGQWESLRETLKELEKQNVSLPDSTYCEILKGLSKRKYHTQVTALADEFTAKKVTFNDAAYAAIIQARTYAKNWEQNEKLFFELEKKDDILLGEDTFRAFARSFALSERFDLLKKLHKSFNKRYSGFGSDKAYHALIEACCLTKPLMAVDYFNHMKIELVLPTMGTCKKFLRAMLKADIFETETKQTLDHFNSSTLEVRFFFFANKTTYSLLSFVLLSIS